PRAGRGGARASRTRSRPRRCSWPPTTARSSPASGSRRTAVCSSAEMPSSYELSVRGTPVQMLQDGSGPPLVFLHGAGGAGRWLAFQERLAKGFSVYFPSHPGHGGSPAAGGIAHISDPAFHYLHLPVHLVLS